MPPRILQLTAVLLTTYAALHWAAPVLAQPASAPPAAQPSSPGSDGAVTKVLLDQANYWYSQNRPDEAARSLQRLLAIAPDNADAIALLGQIDATRGNRSGAEAALTKLRSLRPNDPRVATVEQAIRAGNIDPNALAEARRLAQEGHNAEAVSRYRSLFRGGAPPNNLAPEYYTTLAGTEGGWDVARIGLAQVVVNNLRPVADLSRADPQGRHPATGIAGQKSLHEDGCRQGMATSSRLAAGRNREHP